MSQNQQAPLLPPESLKGLMAQITRKETLDENVERILAGLADDFIDNVLSLGLEFARHRGSDSLEVQDLKFALEKTYQTTLPTALNHLVKADSVVPGEAGMAGSA